VRVGWGAAGTGYLALRLRGKVEVGWAASCELCSNTCHIVLWSESQSNIIVIMACDLVINAFYAFFSLIPPIGYSSYTYTLVMDFGKRWDVVGISGCL